MDEFIPVVANPVNYTESQTIEIAATLIAVASVATSSLSDVFTNNNNLVKKNIEYNASYKEIDQINETFADARKHCST